MARNRRLTPGQVRCLTRHGVRAHPDGLSWKYDPLVSAVPPEDLAVDQPSIWRAIEAPTLIGFGRESRTGDPGADGHAGQFRDARTIGFAGAGHWPHHDWPHHDWPHHDCPEAVAAALRAFLSA